MRIYELLFTDVNGNNKQRSRLHAHSMQEAAERFTATCGDSSKFISITLIEE
jgi:hypothetical protein